MGSKNYNILILIVEHFHFLLLNVFFYYDPISWATTYFIKKVFFWKELLGHLKSDFLYKYIVAFYWNKIGKRQNVVEYIFVSKIVLLYIP